MTHQQIIKFCTCRHMFGEANLPFLSLMKHFFETPCESNVCGMLRWRRAAYISEVLDGGVQASLWNTDGGCIEPALSCCSSITIAAATRAQ